MTALIDIRRMAGESWTNTEQKQLVVSALTSCLEEEAFLPPKASLSMAWAYGKPVVPALPALDRVAEKDADETIKEHAAPKRSAIRN